jgi:uracil-DNA glycosylase family 4
MDGSRRYYLETMGIQMWVLRRPRPEAAAKMLEPPPNPLSPAVPEAVTVPLPLQAEDPGSVADEYAQWAAPRGPGKAVERERESAQTNTDERAARIAQLDWEALQSAVSTCVACGLQLGRTQTVFGVGNRQARWMIIGEAPGAEEDRRGEPFVGRAGKLLDAMLLALGLRREEVYIANILKCRPPNNRDPLPEEARCCRPFLERQMALIKPKIILAVGRIAAQNLLQTDTPINRLRGRVYRVAGIPVVVSYHPAYLLRAPREKRKAWEDLLLARRTLAEAEETQDPS